LALPEDSPLNINTARRQGRSLLEHALALQFEHFVDFIIQRSSFRPTIRELRRCLVDPGSDALLFKLIEFTGIHDGDEDDGDEAH
jgi:hypothetical protein